MVDYNSKETQVQVLKSMKAIVDASLGTHERQLLPLLNSQEKEIYSHLKEFSFDGGSWYRPIHNIIVTICALIICKHENAPRELIVPAALLHDIGYSFLTLDAYNGPAWQNKDIRISHAKIGSKEAQKILTKVGFTEENVKIICDVIATHDNPYLGIPLTKKIEKQHRDCDRCFVPSIVSYYKDFFNYLSNEESKLTPELFLEMRCSSFFTEHKELPINQKTLEFVENQHEPQTTATGEKIVDIMLTQRHKELKEEIFGLNIDEFCNKIKRKLDEEIEYLFSILLENF